MPTNNSNSNANSLGGSLNLLDAALLASFALNVRNSDMAKVGGKLTQEHLSSIDANLIKMNENLETIIKLLEKTLDNK